MFIRFYDLFSGCGGFRIAYERVCARLGIEYKTVCSSEIDVDAIWTYNANFGDNAVVSDVRKMDADVIPDFDGLIGGFPCPSWSRAGAKRGFTDERGRLFVYIIRLLAKKRPVFFVLENVDHLVRMDSGRPFALMLKYLRKFRYRVSYRILNSLDFGVPQYRRRVYILGIRKDIDIIPAFAIPPRIHVPLSDILEKSLSLDDAKRAYYSISGIRYLKHHKDKQKRAGRGFGCVVRDKNKHIVTLVVGGMGRERNLIKDTDNFSGEIMGLDGDDKKSPYAIRRLIPREEARAQGFPDDFILPKSWSACDKVISNAVTVPVAEYACMSVINRLLNRERILNKGRVV